MGKIIRFFKKAFRDMADSTRAQHEVDKADLEAARTEARANFEEARAMGDPAKRQAAQQARIDAANGNQ